MPATERYDVIVIGGGPGGSTVAALAARAGRRVLLLEAAQHPRVHVGESLLPGIIPILESMGALADVEAAGFVRKTGSTHRNWGMTAEWDLWFVDSEQYDHAWLVDRSKFDEILFRAAARAGAETHEHAAAKNLLWEGDRLVGVEWKRRGEDELRRAEAPFTVDASGGSALIARARGLRTMIPALLHQASWAHFEGSGRLPPPRDKQAFFVAEKSHWHWHFPLSDTRTSVGIVRLDDEADTSEHTQERLFDETVAASEELMKVLGPGAKRVTPVRNLRDWSYTMSQLGGPGWMLVGDASGFIDPVLSTGVLLAMHGGTLVARGIDDALAGRRTAQAVVADYEKAQRALFGDLLRIVRFFYERTRFKEDYFWESKKILAERDTTIKPQKAFLVLTSGLVGNLVIDEKRTATDERREALARPESGTDITTLTPESLGFVCMHLKYPYKGAQVAAYVLIERTDPAAPSLTRSRNWDVNVLVPNSVPKPDTLPELAPQVFSLAGSITKLDDVPGESLASFWKRRSPDLIAISRALPQGFELVRIFGE